MQAAFPGDRPLHPGTGFPRPRSSLAAASRDASRPPGAGITAGGGCGRGWGGGSRPRRWRCTRYRRRSLPHLAGGVPVSAPEGARHGETAPSHAGERVQRDADASRPTPAWRRVVQTLTTSQICVLEHCSLLSACDMPIYHNTQQKQVSMQNSSFFTLV